MPRMIVIVTAALALTLGLNAPVRAQGVPVSDLAAAVVKIKTYINPDARTADNLGRQREGSAVVIDSDGLVVTIGYLMVEAQAAEIVTNDGRAVPANIVGYDHETGFGLLRAAKPLNVQPMQLGSSAGLKEGQNAAIIGAGGMQRIAAVEVVSRREFAGSWEYLLDGAIFTTPAYPDWSGAALVNAEGKLVGVGSLIVGDAGRKGAPLPGNMFVPIDRLPPILGDLLANGYSNAPPTPWLGVTTDERRGGLVVVRPVPGGPAEKAGVRRGDVISGVGGKSVEDLGDFYRKVRALGAAGVTVPLDIERDGAKQTIDIKSINRRDHLKLNSTL